MEKIEFPNPALADEDGIVAVGGNLSPEVLVAAYSKGIFPWPFDENSLVPWFSPDPRCVLEFSDFKITRTLRKFLKKHSFQVTFDQVLGQVIESCAKVPRAGGDGNSTWITSEMIAAYKTLGERGFCHSVECWSEDRLVGGLYGVSIGGMFAGESMFHLEDGASKVCLVALVELLESKGGKWIDCQQMTSLLESFGAKEIPRADFLNLLEESVSASSLF